MENVMHCLKSVNQIYDRCSDFLPTNHIGYSLQHCKIITTFNKMLNAFSFVICWKHERIKSSSKRINVSVVDSIITHSSYISITHQILCPIFSPSFRSNCFAENTISKSTLHHPNAKHFHWWLQIVFGCRYEMLPKSCFFHSIYFEKISPFRITVHNIWTN